jgi:hypothetical protein
VVLGVVPANSVVWTSCGVDETPTLSCIVSHHLLGHSYNDEMTQRSRKVASAAAMIPINSQAVPHAMFPQ